MKTLVAFDEVEYRLEEFNNSALSVLFAQEPILRGLIRSLICFGWEGTPNLLSDTYCGEGDDINKYQSTLNRLGYESEIIQRTTVKQLKAQEYPFFLDLGYISGVVLAIKDNVATIYDYHNDILVDEPISDQPMMLCVTSRYSRLFREEPPQSREQGNWIKFCFYRYGSEIKRIALLSFFINVFAALIPFFIMSVYQFGMSSSDNTTLYWLSMAAVIVITLEYLCKLYRLQILKSSGTELAVFIAYQVTSKLIWLPYALTSSASVSSQLARLRDIDQFRKLLTTEATLSYFDLPFVVIFIVAILMLSSAAAITVVVGIIAMLLFCVYSRYIYQQVLAQSSKASVLIGYQWNEILTSLHSIQGLPILRVIRTRFQASQTQSNADNTQLYKTNQFIQQVGQCITQIIGVTSIIIAVIAVIWGDSSPSSMLVIIILVWKALTPIMSIYNALSRFHSLKMSAQQINSLMSLPDDRERLHKSPPLNQLSGIVNVQGLGHRYSGCNTGLTNLAFQLKPGERCTIVSPSGSGKTTLLNIIAGLEKNYQGVISYDGYNLRQFNDFRFRDAVTYIPFDMHFFDDTLKQNFLFYNSFMTDDEIVKIFHHFKLQEWFPERLETRLSKPFLMGLPSGILQVLRLCIGLGSSRQGVVIIDEPLVGCHQQFNHLFTSLYNDLLANRTIIFSTSDHSLIASCQKCLLLDNNGGQKYFGPPNKVLQSMH